MSEAFSGTCPTCHQPDREAEVQALLAKLEEAEKWPFKDGGAWVGASDLREVEAERDAAIGALNAARADAERLAFQLDEMQEVIRCHNRQGANWGEVFDRMMISLSSAGAALAQHREGR